METNDDKALKRGAEAGYALAMALKDVISPEQLQIALRAAIEALKLAAAAAS
jgi:hypothetical protein